MLNVERLVLHVDLDCFYASVEHVRLGIPRAVPLAVQQWEGLIAVNYAARACGVSRHERLAEAKRKCPDLRLVHVETIGCAAGQGRSSGKVSLERYRQASARVFGVFRRFSSVCEKGGLDEAFLDMTHQVEQLCGLSSVDWEAEHARLLRRPEGHYEPTEECPGGEMVVLEGPLVSTNAYDRRLLAAAIVARRLQAAVVKEVGYTISVGVACNKLLAKVASAMHKPSRITVVPPRAVPQLMQGLPLTKIRNLGGKLGQELQELGFTSAGEVQGMSQMALTKRFGEKAGAYIWRAVRGFHDDPVQEKGVSKSMLAAKSFTETADMVAIRRWLGILSVELAARMLRDVEQNGRRPRTLQLYYRGGLVGDRSKSAPMPSQASHLVSMENARCHARSSSAVGSPLPEGAWPSGQPNHTFAMQKGPTEALDVPSDSSLGLPGGIQPWEEGGNHHEPLCGGEALGALGENGDVLPDDRQSDKDEGFRLGESGQAKEARGPMQRVGPRAERAHRDEPGRDCQVAGISEDNWMAAGPATRALSEVLGAAALRLFEKADGSLPCSRLALAAGDFEDLQAPGMQSIQKFFVSGPKGSAGPAPPAPLEDPKLPVSSQPRPPAGILRFLQPQRLQSATSPKEAAADVDSPHHQGDGCRGQAYVAGQTRDASTEQLGDLKLRSRRKAGCEDRDEWEGAEIREPEGKVALDGKGHTDVHREFGSEFGRRQGPVTTATSEESREPRPCLERPPSANTSLAVPPDTGQAIALEPKSQGKIPGNESLSEMAMVQQPNRKFEFSAPGGRDRAVAEPVSDNNHVHMDSIDVREQERILAIIAMEKASQRTNQGPEHSHGNSIRTNHGRNGRSLKRHAATALKSNQGQKRISSFFTQSSSSNDHEGNTRPS